jgi:hypothetical protein
MSADKLRDRLVLAALEALTEGDPVLIIGVGDNEVRLGWVDEHELPERLTMGKTNRLQIERSVDVPLRDRIAVAIKAADVMPSTDCDPYVEMADAVIAELKLRRETVGLIHRYVTNWQGSDNA